jgi:hypothetical protein
MHVAANNYRRCANPAAPDRKLWTYVLRLAINDLSSSQYHAQAAAWFVSDSEELYSFRWVCDAVRISPARVLRKVAAILDGGPADRAVTRLRHAGAR